MSNLLETIIALTVLNSQTNMNLECAIEILNESVQKTDNIYLNFANISGSGSVNTFKKLPICNITPNITEDVPMPSDRKFKLRPTIFLIEISENFAVEIQLYADNIMWNPRAKFIFITSAKNLNDFEFNQFIKLKWIQQFILIKNGVVYGWGTFDLAEIYKSDGINDLTVLGNCSTLQTNYFEPKYFSNFEFLKVRVSHVIAPPWTLVDIDDPNIANGDSRILSTTPRSGIEINIMKTLFARVNVELRFQNSSFNSIRYVAQKKIDIFFGKLMGEGGCLNIGISPSLVCQRVIKLRPCVARQDISEENSRMAIW